MLRPIRVRLEIMPDSAAGLHRAVELAIGTWGGRHFLCLRPAAYKRVLRMAGAMGGGLPVPRG
jgi:hypothetical protein